jgi:benzoyl-CoA reductase/2-hydroxyglutaryl-CoA dehydratase subunit BcrC/BadD/HgdB
MGEPAGESRAALEMIRSRPARLSGLGAFEAALGDATPTALLRHAMGTGKPAVGYFCALAPLELIEAVGAVPVRLDAGSAECANLASDAVHRDACPMVRSAWGLLSLLEEQPELLRAIKLLIVPRACDWKAALPESLVEAFGIEVVSLDVPRNRRGELARGSWRRQIAETARTLERVAGARIKRGALRDAISLYRRASGVSRFLNAAMACPKPPTWGADVLLALAASLLMPMGEWIEAGEALAEELRGRLLSGETVGEDLPRLLLAGSPCVWPHFALPALAEECGGLIVADESCSGSRVLYDAVHVDEAAVPDMVDAIADRYLLPSTCPVFSDPDDRLVRLDVLSEDFAVEGVVYHVLKSCYVYDMQLEAAREKLQEAGLPLLRIETDYGETNQEALRTRLEAFMETIRERREPQAQRPIGAP